MKHQWLQYIESGLWVRLLYNCSLMLKDVLIVCYLMVSSLQRADSFPNICYVFSPRTAQYVCVLLHSCVYFHLSSNPVFVDLLIQKVTTGIEIRRNRIMWICTSSNEHWVHQLDDRKRHNCPRNKLNFKNEQNDIEHLP